MKKILGYTLVVLGSPAILVLPLMFLDTSTRGLTNFEVLTNISCGVFTVGLAILGLPFVPVLSAGLALLEKEGFDL